MSTDRNIVHLKPADLKPYPKNSRTHSEDQVSQIVESIKAFGFTNPILLWRDDVIVAGHGRKLAAEKLGLSTVPCIRLGNLDEDQMRAYVLADNKVSENAGWDFQILASELNDLIKTGINMDLTGFTDDEIQTILEENGFEEEDNRDGDATPEPQELAITERGDIWILGNHRLMCGDSTSRDDVDRLMNGEKADMVFTDPPYNTGMTAQSQAGVSGTLLKGDKYKSDGKRLSHMFNDSFTDEEWQNLMSKFCENYFLNLKDDSVAYICLDWRRNHELIPHIKKHFKLSNIIIWDKVVHGLGSDYKYVYEIINVCKKGKPDLNTNQGDDREYYDIWHIQRKMGRDDDHATKKPIELCERPIRHASKKNDLVLDLFLGSGSTLIACEKTGRKCFGMELAPNYCDVIIKRWQEFTGREASLSTTQQTFEQVKLERTGSATF